MVGGDRKVWFSEAAVLTIDSLEDVPGSVKVKKESADIIEIQRATTNLFFDVSWEVVGAAYLQELAHHDVDQGARSTQH